MNGYPTPDGEAVECHQPPAPGTKPTFRLSGPFSGAEGLPEFINSRQHLCEAHKFDSNDKFGDLQQRLESTLLAYYKRESSFTKHVDVRDRPETGISLPLLQMDFSR